MVFVPRIATTDMVTRAGKLAWTQLKGIVLLQRFCHVNINICDLSKFPSILCLHNWMQEALRIMLA